MDSYDTVKELIKNNPDMDPNELLSKCQECKDIDFWTQVELASMYGNLALVQAMCNEYVPCSNRILETVLQSAARYGQLPIVQWVCSLPPILSNKFIKHDAHLIAICNDNHHIAKWLYTACDVERSILCYRKGTFEFACESGDLEYAKAIHEAYTNESPFSPREIVDKFYGSLFCIAEKHKNGHIARWFIDLGVTPDSKSEYYPYYFHKTLDKQIADYESQIADRTQQIASLTTLLTELRTGLNKLKAELRPLENQRLNAPPIMT